MMKRFLTIFFLLMTVFVFVQAQSDKTVEYTYVYHASYNESRQQAEQNAINCAKVEALRKEFGTVLSGASATSLITKNKITESKFVYIGGEGEVNGEWIADLMEPKITTTLEDNGLCVTVTVKGKAREITNNPISFEAKTLRNKPDVAFESTEFTAGNHIYIHFTSPVDGFLTIYLLDGETAYCLLPYANTKDGIYPIIHGKEYIFFSRDVYDEDDDLDAIDEYSLTVEDKHQDLNQLYFIFSPQKFTKAVDRFRKTDNGTIYPRMLSWANFQKWIMRARKTDKEMSVQTKYIVINPIKD